MKKTTKNLLLNGALIVLMALLPLLSKDEYYRHILVMTYYSACLASSWNLVGGFMGQITFAHMAYFGIGAYSVTILSVTHGVSPWIGAVVGMLLSAAACFLISYPTLKIRGPFFVLITIAFLNICRILAVYFRGLTKGSMGISTPFKPSFANFVFRSKLAYVYISLILLVIVLAINYYLLNSKLGYRIVALRENRDAAQAIGVNPTWPRIIVACISAALAGLTGVVYARYSLFLDPDIAFSMDTNTRIILMAIIGGTGSLWGPVLGAALLVPSAEILRAALSKRAGLDQLIYGIILIVLILLQPEGLLGGLQKIRDRVHVWSMSKNASKQGK